MNLTVEELYVIIGELEVTKRKLMAELRARDKEKEDAQQAPPPVLIAVP